MNEQDILICKNCHRRIWRPSDQYHFVDSYVYDQHVNCDASIDAEKSRKKFFEEAKK